MLNLYIFLWNSIEDEGGEALEEALKVNTSLAELDLNYFFKILFICRPYFERFTQRHRKRHLWENQSFNESQV